MQTKTQILSVRKTLYGLMMLAAILSAFGAWNVPTARAQESATETLPSAVVSLSADQTSFGTTEDVILHVTVTNLNSYSIRMLKWLTLVGGVEGPLFTVTRNGESIAYIGKLVKRVASTEKDYIALAAGKSLTRDVNLSAYYELSSGCGSGMYCADANGTRAQMAIFLLKGKHGSSYIPPVATGVFSDVSIGSFAADWIEQLAAGGITSGCGGLYCPNTNVTRDQMAVFLVRAFNLP
jgi:hypothetical protein